MRWKAIQTVDFRSLAAFRVLSSALLLLDLGRRWEARELFYLPGGVSDLSFSSEVSYSIFASANFPSLIDLIFAVSLFSFLSLLVGWKTRFFKPVSFVLFAGWTHWNFPTIHGGHMLLGVFLLWGCALPLGEVWSLDHFLRGSPKVPRLYRDPMVAVLKVQFLAVYFSSFLSKVYFHPGLLDWHDRDWLTGDAVYYSLNYKTVAYGSMPGWLALHLPVVVLKLMTWLTLSFECGVPLLLLFCEAMRPLRRICIVSITLFCLSTWATLYVGDIAKIMLSASVIFWAGEDWNSVQSRIFPKPQPRDLTGDEHACASGPLSKLRLMLWGVLVYSNAFMLVEAVSGSTYFSALRPDTAIAFQNYALSGQNWDYFWNGPHLNQSFQFLGTLNDGRTVDLRPAFLDSKNWDHLDFIPDAQLIPMDGVVAHYGLLRFRFLDAFFNFGYRRAGGNAPPDLPFLCAYLKRVTESKFPVQIKLVRVQALNRSILSVEHRNDPPPAPSLGAEYRFAF